jgi:F-type H+-transporting ATPase subunit b
MLLASSGDFGLSYILEVVALLIVVAIIWRKVLPPLKRAMARREQTIAGQLSSGDEARALAAALVAQRRLELDNGRAEAASIIEQARQSATALLSDGERLAQDDYERAVARAHSEVDAARARVESEIMAELSDVIVAAAHAVVVAELNESIQHRLIDEAISAAESEAR